MFDSKYSDKSCERAYTQRLAHRASLVNGAQVIDMNANQTIFQSSLKKAVYLCVTGALVFIIGCVISYYHFYFRSKCCSAFDDTQMESPSCKHSCTDSEVLDDRENSDPTLAWVLQIVGPITLALGLLTSVCGLVWMPIIKDRFEKQRQEDSIMKYYNQFG